MKAKLYPLALLPGLALCSGVTLAAIMAGKLEVATVGQPWIEPLVLAILIGTAVRTAWKPSVQFAPGVHFTAKTLLEVAVALMGATISFGAMLAAGWPLLMGIIGAVFVAIVVSFLLGRALALPPRMALLIACGNAICGNSAIAAVAPVIDADSDDVATAIAFTAVLGVAVVLLLPTVASMLHLSTVAGGALAGFTVYAVPQVLAATAPMGTAAVQIGTLVKLVRVLTLGPVVTGLSLLKARRGGGAPKAHRRLSITRFLPLFILVFLALAIARSLSLIPDAAVTPARATGNMLTIMAMAALGLGVDLRQVTAAGPRVTITVACSLLLLGTIAVFVLHFAKLA